VKETLISECYEVQRLRCFGLYNDAVSGVRTVTWRERAVAV
jgi:hypothetical protein